jgi:hypothetical protein
MTDGTLQLINLIVTGVILPLAGFTLHEVVVIGKSMSATKERLKHGDEIFIQLKLRQDEIEVKLHALEIEIEKLKARGCLPST